MTTLNTFPYYDDYSGEKGFHQILFKPGYAVQARELTQMQTMLQEQIRRFGNHIFRDGTVVFGCAESSNFAFPYVKVENTNAEGNTITDAVLLSSEGKTVVGTNFGVRATIKKVATGSTTESPNLKTLFVQYTATGSDNATVTFGVGETLTIEETGETFVVAGSSETPIGNGSLFSVGDGVIYANGKFILNTNQTVVLSRYSTTPTVKVGFVVRETIVNADDDESLLDPAQGSSNFTAPGADRFKLTTEIVVVNDGEVAPEGFYILFDVDNGQIKRKYNTTQYAELNKTLARRTYDESGDYTVRPFPLIIREHLNTGTNGGRYLVGEGGDAGKLVIGVEPGKAYVKGFEHELFATENLDIQKAYGLNHESTKQNQPITTGYGAYVTVNSVTGVWPINGANTVNLVQNPSTVIGTARVREIEFVSGTTYNIYLYDINMTGAFSLVDRITFGATASATVVDTTAVLQESGQNIAVFESPFQNIKGFTDASYVYRKVISGISATGSTFNTSITGEAWAFTTATVSSNRSNDVIVVRESDGAILGITAATVSGTTLTVTLQSPLGAATNVTVMGLVRRTVSHNTKNLLTGRFVRINTASHPNGANGPYSLGTYDVYRIEEVWSAVSSGPGDTTYPANPATDPLWTNVTANFRLDDGQRDATYALGAIIPNAPQTSRKLIVKFSYFEHGTGSGYYTVDSYPKPVENATPTSSQILWQEIPQFLSSSGKRFDLRNCVDFRPTAALTATDSITVAGSTVNPSAAVSSFVAGFTHPAPKEEFIGDITIHLPRVDRVVLDAEGQFVVVSGVPSEAPVRPRQPENSMTLGFIEVAPYPSLSPEVAKQYSTPQYACRVSVVDNRRFTMRDIGDIHRRIDRLEYYTSLSLLEQNTANLLIPSATGEDRFKNGILVDQFIGHNIGNVYDPAYRCSISNNELRPFYNIDNVDFTVGSLSTLVRRPDDAAIVVRQLSSASVYQVGTGVTSSSSATGVVRQVVTVATSPGYRWVRLYLTNVTGTFGVNNTITQGSVTGTITYDLLATTVLPTALRPDLVWSKPEGPLVTLPYVHRVFAQNPYASKTRNAVSQLLFTYNGDLTLTPPVDIWTDTTQLPSVQVNVGGTADNWENLERAWGTEWGAWENSWQGVTTTTFASPIGLPAGNGLVQFGTLRQTVETTTQRQERVGVGINVETSTVRTDLGNRIISTSLVPFMRSTIVRFRGERMKPNTRVYAFFDKINVSQHCRTGSDAFGSPLIVGTDGTITGEFRIPASTFTVGTKTFALADSTTDPLAASNYTTASAQFTASGLAVVEQGTVVSTVVPDITQARQVETRETTTSRVVGVELSTPPFNPDPIAQTFFVSDNPNGILLSKLDVFFKTKSTTSPITLQIREVVNGYPSETILPYSSVTLSPKDINVSENASAPTPFIFDAPVYLKNDTEYCFVLLPAGNDENYEVWVSELGQNQIGTTQRIDKQPYAGVLFVSGNNRTWNAIQSEDVKFTLYQCDFDPTDAGTIVLNNTPITYLDLASVSAFNVGDTLIYVSSGVETGRGTIKYLNRLDGTVQMTPISGTTSAGHTVVSRAAALTGTVSTTAPATLTGSGTSFLSQVLVGDILLYNGNILGTVSAVVSDTEITLSNVLGVSFTNQTVYDTNRTTITTVESKRVTAISPTIGFLDFNNTDTIWEYKIHSAGGIDPLAFSPLNVTGTTELASECAVFSNTVTPNTFVIRGVLTTEVRNLSPVIDLQKIGSVIVGNSINNDATGENGNTGNALSRYISRRVVLSDGQESEDLRVYLTANIKAGSSIRVYAKLLNDTDPVAFENRPWLLLNEEAPVNNTGYKEYLYTLPVGAGTTAEGALVGGTGYTYSTIYQGFKTFAIKIVLLSSNPASVPTVRDMRAIALLL